MAEPYKGTLVEQLVQAVIDCENRNRQPLEGLDPKLSDCTNPNLDIHKEDTHENR